MKNLVFLPFVLLLFGNSAFGQNNTVSEFDLYGCWALERNKKENGLKKRIYRQCRESEGELVIRNSEIIFLAYNKCKFQAVIQDALCPVIYRTVEGTWKYDKKSGLVEIYYPKDFKKEFWDKVKEENPELKIPNPRLKTIFRIVGLENGNLKIEKTTPSPRSR